MKDMVEKWKSTPDQQFTVTDFLEGNEAADRFSDINSSNYDFILIGTSSYGEGDAPGGFGKFMYQLQEAASSGEKPLEGLQHAVLGFGSTIYETYQNCPRLTDKYLGEAGSRRCMKRLEVDEMDEGDGTETVNNWAKEIAKICVRDGSAGAKLDPVCDWVEPSDEVLPKKLGDDGFEVGNGVPEMGPIKIIVALAVAGFSFYYYKNNIANEGA